MPLPNYFFWFRHRLPNAHFKAHTHVYPGVTITRFKFNCFKKGLIVQLIHIKFISTVYRKFLIYLIFIINTLMYQEFCPMLTFFFNQLLNAHFKTHMYIFLVLESNILNSIALKKEKITCFYLCK
jgi:hypothetical protein